MRIDSVRALLLVAWLPMAMAAAPPAQLPGRALACTMHRVANFDPSRTQTPEELVLEGESALDLYIGPGPVRTNLPPEPFEPPEPTPPGTRVVRDTGKLLDGVPGPFTRVVDRWPERVEIANDLPDNHFNLIIVAPIDPVAGTATLLVTYVDITMTYDGRRVWLGDCTVRAPAPPPADAPPAP